MLYIGQPTGQWYLSHMLWVNHVHAWEYVWNLSTYYLHNILHALLVCSGESVQKHQPFRCQLISYASSVSYETKLIFVEIVMFLSLIQHPPYLPLGLYYFSIYSVSALKKKFCW